MRRLHLPPPRPLLLATSETWPSERAPESRGARDAEGVVREGLRRPAPTPLARRPFFNPATGWIRRMERAGSHWLSRNLFPRIPGLSRPYGRQLERGLTVAEGRVDLDRLGRGWDGCRLLLLTDLHAGPFLSPAVLGRVVDRLLELEPHLVLLGGDLATSRAEEVRSVRRALGRLRGPLGGFVVLGNHDHYTGEPERIGQEVEAAGLRMLHNRHEVLRRDGDPLTLAGIDDLLVGDPRLEEALEGRPPGAPTLLLSHNPDVFPAAASRGVDLVLAGHTHGGQIRIPGLPVLVRQSRYRLDEGRFLLGGSELVVSRGLGVVGLPLRVACAPQAVLLTLRSGRGAGRPISRGPWRPSG